MALQVLGKLQEGCDQTVLGFGGQLGDVGNQFRPVLSTESQILGKMRLDLGEESADGDLLAGKNLDEQLIGSLMVHEVAVYPGEDIESSAVVVLVPSNQVELLEVLPIDGFVGRKTR